MKKITIFFNIINYVICDFVFAFEMGFIRLFPLYWIYKIAAKCKVTKIERPLYKYFWWVDTDGTEKKFKREKDIYFFNHVGSTKVVLAAYLAPTALCVQIIICGILNKVVEITWVFYILFFIFVAVYILDKKKTIRYIKIFNRIRKQHIIKWRIMAATILISEWLLGPRLHEIINFMKSIFL